MKRLMILFAFTLGAFVFTGSIAKTPSINLVDETEYNCSEVVVDVCTVSIEKISLDSTMYVSSTDLSCESTNSININSLNSASIENSIEGSFIAYSNYGCMSYMDYDKEKLFTTDYNCKTNLIKNKTITKEMPDKYRYNYSLSNLDLNSNLSKSTSLYKPVIRNLKNFMYCSSNTSSDIGKWSNWDYTTIYFRS